MTDYKIDEIKNLLNYQKKTINALKAKFEIALSKDFLDNKKHIIHEYLSDMDDDLDNIKLINESISLNL